MTRVTIGWIAVTASVMLLASCGGGSSTTPPPGGNNFLAGGGRSGSGDDFSGGPNSSGPQSPQDDSGGGPAGQPEPYKGFIPVFYADSNCFPASFETVLTSQTDFQTWWTTAVACQPHYGAGLDEPPVFDPPNPGDGSGNGTDGGWVDPGEPYDPYGEIAPTVDFDAYVVVAIGLDAQATFGRSLFVQSTEPATGGGTTVSYEISTPGADCVEFFAPQDPPITSAPTIAVLVPKPIDAPVTFTHTESTWNCTWEPDPTQPLTLYYTDASCDLGPGHSVITSEAVWLAWLDAAFDCEIARWDDPYGYPVTGGGGGSSSPGSEGPNEPGQPPTPGPDGGFGGGDNPVDNGVDPTPPPPSSWGIDVDFTTHAVILLRANAQTKWGGGIWLNSITTSATGTVVEYTELSPSGDCPESESADALRPTVAIRVPLPLTGPITYVQHVEEISCEWGDDGTVVEPPQPGEGGEVPPEPRPL
ncbi:MAG: hypothetical protein ABI743_05225 [bacterium]